MHGIQPHPNALEARPSGPRMYRPLRQRVRFEVDAKSQPTRRMVEEMETIPGRETPQRDLIDRSTLCLPDFGNDSILHGEDDGFKDVLRQYFPSSESNATERLVKLKSKLRNASTHDFWGLLMEEMCDITSAQCGFVAKRMLVDDQDSAVEMPELGEPGSCLMGVALYVNNGADVKELYRDYRYHAYGTPCAHMRHDKVFILPERMAEFLPNNPNAMPWKQSEAYIGVPLFTEGKCFAHFGMIWSTEGALNRTLGWSFIEMFLHSLEDMILQRILEGRGFAKEVSAPESKSAKVIPLSAITASQSLKPYARSLSHELRTPMQGVVGMLDIMYSTVLDAMSKEKSECVKSVFEDLKSHIEVVQDSSRRAVEAADNVVHAYDLNMQMPETPLSPNEIRKGLATPPASSCLHSPTIISESLTPPLLGKHEREETDPLAGPPLKRMFRLSEAEIIETIHFEEASTNGPSIAVTEFGDSISSKLASPKESPLSRSPIISPELLNPTHRRIFTREFMRSLVNEALRNGHPTSEIHSETELGESIDVKTIGSRGEVQDRTIVVEIETDVPDVIITEEQPLQFALQKLVDNAIKFTERGTIRITVKVCWAIQVIEIWVVDTGCGIAQGSRTNLFKPHFQEDASISRARDGLGLSLFNAKAHVRKHLGGDVTLERSETEGPSKGSEFLIRLPISTLYGDDSHTPLIGTPPPTASQLRPGSWPDLSAPICVPDTFSILPQPAPAKTKLPSRKRIAFNSKLAAQYPLNILIAEDNAINRNVAIGSLAKLGYAASAITIAFDGAEAVKQYKESLSRPPSQRFNAVLMDIWMPNMDGYEASSKILEMARMEGEEVKVIAVTADVTGDCLERAKESGMIGFLAKPYKVFDIERLITEYFKSCC